jgi:hypothetical protein
MRFISKSGFRYILYKTSCILKFPLLTQGITFNSMAQVSVELCPYPPASDWPQSLKLHVGSLSYIHLLIWFFFLFGWLVFGSAGDWTLGLTLARHTTWATPPGVVIFLYRILIYVQADLDCNPPTWASLSIWDDEGMQPHPAISWGSLANSPLPATSGLQLWSCWSLPPK